MVPAAHGGSRNQTTSGPVECAAQPWPPGDQTKFLFCARGDGFNAIPAHIKRAGTVDIFKKAYAKLRNEMIDN
jgi:hypothetical protein